MCDLAETYHIFDYKALPPTMVARLVFGLRQDSRLKMALSGTKYSMQDLLLAQCADALHLLWWAQTQDGQSNRNRPKSIVALLVGKGEEHQKLDAFDSGEDFERAREAIINR